MIEIMHYSFLTNIMAPPIIYFAGEIVEGSKELDFMASMEDNETEAFPSAAVGTKRSIGSVSLSKDEMGGNITFSGSTCHSLHFV